jgi:hypothetical protein
MQSLLGESQFWLLDLTETFVSTTLKVYLSNAGKLLQSFDFSSNDDIPEFTCADMSPSGGCVAIGSFDRYYQLSQRTRF